MQTHSSNVLIPCLAGLLDTPRDHARTHSPQKPTTYHSIHSKTAIAEIPPILASSISADRIPRCYRRRRPCEKAMIGCLHDFWELVCWVWVGIDVVIVDLCAVDGWGEDEEGNREEEGGEMHCYE